MSLKSNEKKFLLVFVIPMIVIILTAPTLFLMGFNGAGEVVSYGGTFGVIVFAMCYIVFFDSKKRWPNSSAFERFAKVVTFTR